MLNPQRTARISNRGQRNLQLRISNRGQRDLQLRRKAGQIGDTVGNARNSAWGSIFTDVERASRQKALSILLDTSLGQSAQDCEEVWCLGKRCHRRRQEHKHWGTHCQTTRHPAVSVNRGLRWSEQRLSQPRLKAQLCPGLNAGPIFALQGKTSTTLNEVPWGPLKPSAQCRRVASWCRRGCLSEPV